MEKVTDGARNEVVTEEGTPVKVTYRYNGVEGEGKEIKGYNEETQQMNKPIYLSQGTLQALLGSNNGKSFSFDYLVDGKTITDEKDIDKLRDKHVLFTGENTRIEINRDITLNLGFNNRGSDSVFAIMGVDLRNKEGYNNNILFYNEKSTTINVDHLLFLGNRIYNENDDTYLIENFSKSTLTLNGKSIVVESNTIKSMNNFTRLVDNFVTMTFGSVITETLTFRGNDVNGNKETYLIDNYTYILNLNSNTISITDNSISPTFKFDGNNEDKYSVVMRNEGTINVNLYGDNSSFTLANNRMTEGINGKGVIGMVMMDGSQLNFNNNSFGEATIKLEHSIVSQGNNIRSTIKFKGLKRDDNDNQAESVTYSQGTKVELGTALDSFVTGSTSLMNAILPYAIPAGCGRDGLVGVLYRGLMI